MNNILFTFIFFSFIGYICESVYLHILKRKSNRGLYGPWCPIYGLGGIIISGLFINLTDYPILIFIFGVIVASIIEYTIGYLLEKIFEIRWWDYTGRFGSINGRICFRNSFLFGILAVLTMYLFYPILIFIYASISSELIYVITITLTFLMVLDSIVSIFEASNLRRYIEVISKNLKTKEKNKTVLRDRMFGIIKKLEGEYSPKRILENFPNLKAREEKALEYVKWYYKKMKGGKK